MFTALGHRARLLAACLLMLLLAAPARAQQLDPSILSTLNYDQLQWLEDTATPGSWYAVLSGDPSTEGRFVILNKVLKGTFNRPHFHATARQIYVADGTWWVGSGADRNIADSVAKREGSYVDQPANQVHWDGAKDEDVLLLIAGEGPATETLIN
jgi:quercetin dioxygenase-like cupin family protein